MHTYFTARSLSNFDCEFVHSMYAHAGQSFWGHFSFVLFPLFLSRIFLVNAKQFAIFCDAYPQVSFRNKGEEIKKRRCVYLH